MEEKYFYIVNPKGAIHIVSETHARARLTIVGWRLATAEERAAYEAANGNQRADRPLVAPFKPIPDDVDILAGAEVVVKPTPLNEEAAPPEPSAAVKKSKK